MEYAGDLGSAATAIFFQEGLDGANQLDLPQQIEFYAHDKSGPNQREFGQLCQSEFVGWVERSDTHHVVRPGISCVRRLTV
jgi:hypothetical protein